MQSLPRAVHDRLATFRLFEILIALVCIVMPGLLKLTDTGASGFRSCISDYVYMTHSYFFGMLLCIAGMLFIFHGAVYFRNAFSLTPYHQYFISHNIFAGIFFLGNAVVIAIFHKTKYRVISLILAVLTVLALALCLLFNTVSLFAAEWISLTVIGIHFILEALGAIRFN
jgi:cell division protein FtsW (lipid II flippase)